MITAARAEDHAALIELWEHSIRATHFFLEEDYLQEIKALLPSILPQVTLFVYRGNDDQIEGFAGVAGKKIEMLFIHPSSRNQGIGHSLTQFCLHELEAETVEVNEQNTQAIGFYLKMGFAIVDRQDVDGLGRPYPLLLMKYSG
jgi:putative acetyltransferase